MSSGLTRVFVITKKSVFSRCNFVNKQIQSFPSIVFWYRLQSISRVKNISENVFNFGNGAPDIGEPIKNVPVQYEKLNKFLKNKIHC